METVVVTPRFLDKDGYWKYSVRFERGNSASVYEYFFDTEQEAKDSEAKANSLKQTLKNVDIETAKLDKLKMKI